MASAIQNNSQLQQTTCELVTEGSTVSKQPSNLAHCHVNNQSTPGQCSTRVVQTVAGLESKPHISSMLPRTACNLSCCHQQLMQRQLHKMHMVRACGQVRSLQNNKTEPKPCNAEQTQPAPPPSEPPHALHSSNQLPHTIHTLPDSACAAIVVVAASYSCSLAYPLSPSERQLVVAMPHTPHT